jgi:hypothetical protein
MRDLWRIKDEIMELLAQCDKELPYWWVRAEGLKAALGVIEAAIIEREYLSLQAAGYSE